MQHVSGVSHLAVGDLRNWLLNDAVAAAVMAAVVPGIMPEMTATVSKFMRV